MSYANVADIKARIPGRKLDRDSQPSEQQVADWIEEAEAMLNNVLASAGMPAPYTADNAVLILKMWVCEYVTGLTRMAHASSGGDGSNDDGKDLVDKWYGRIADIQKNGAAYDSLLSAGSPTESSSRVRGANKDGAVEPEFTRDMVM